MDSVDILILNKDYEEFLVDALESCINQTYKYINIIVVDDNSSDGSRDIILKYNKLYGINYKFLSENSGISKVRNTLTSLSTSNYLSFLSSDDYYTPEFIETSLYFLKKQPNTIGGVYSSFYKIDKDKNPTGVVKAENFSYKQKLKIAERAELSVPFESALFRKSIFNVGVPFREEILVGEESLFISEILNYNFDFTIFSSQCYAYKRYHEKSGHGLPESVWETERIKRVSFYAEHYMSQK